MEDPTNFVKPEKLDQHRAERAKRGFSMFDWWNFHNHLSFVIVGGLEEFKTSGHSYPADLTLEEWNTILDTMIEGFKAHVEISEMEGYEPKKESWTQFEAPRREKFNQGMALFAEYYGTLWD